MVRILLLSALLVGCTTVSEIPLAGDEYIVSCDSDKGFAPCYTRANELCPHGWDSLWERQDTVNVTRRELHVMCD